MPFQERNDPMIQTRPPKHAPRGFTLIELLIVVAIIAMLSAIAVPNYMEAQTRVKASRARADLRSVATGLESYFIDRNAYPTMIEPGFTGGVAPLQASHLKWWYVPNALSTPVAYLTSADLRCPFGGDRPQSANFPDELWRRYSYENIRELEAAAAGQAPFGQPFAVLGPKYGPQAHLDVRCGLWRVLCIGPDVTWMTGSAWTNMVQYDPTNGITSLGNIMRTQNDPLGIGSEQR